MDQAIWECETLMLIRMVGKLLFKATLPLVFLAGIATYGYYMKGGDPGALWGGVFERVGVQARQLASGVRDDASRAAGTLSRSASVGLNVEDTGQAGKSRVYKWVDADGVTHFSSSAPAGIESSLLMIDPDVNVLAPVTAPARSLSPAGSPSNHDDGQKVLLPGGANRPLTSSGGRTLRASDRAAADQDMNDVVDQLGGRLPGIAGHILNPQKDPATGVNAVELLNSLR